MRCFKRNARVVILITRLHCSSTRGRVPRPTAPRVQPHLQGDKVMYSAELTGRELLRWDTLWPLDLLNTRVRAHSQTRLKSNSSAQLEHISQHKAKNPFCSLTGYNPASTMDHSLCTCFPQEDNYRSVVSHTQTHRAFERSGFPRKHAHTHSHTRVRSHSFATDGEPVQSEPWLVIPLPDHDTLQDGGWSAGLMVWGPAGSHRPIGRSHFVPESTDQPCRSQAVCHSISDETVTIGEGQAARSTPSTRR